MEMTIYTRPSARIARVNSALFALMMCLMITNDSIAQTGMDAQVKLQNRYNQKVEVALNKSSVLQLTSPVKKVSIGNPNIADILVLSAGQIYILGKGLGSTNVLLWDTRDQIISNLDVEVTHDLEGLKAKLHELLPDEKINVYTSQSSIILSGLVSSVTRMDAVIRIAESFTGESRVKKEAKGEKGTGGIINLMQVGGAQQVMLEVKVAEISRTLLNQFGIKFDAISSNGAGTQMGGLIGRGATFPPALNADGLKTPIFGNFSNSPMIGPAVTEVLANTSALSRGFYGSFLDDNMLFNFILNAAKDDGIAKVLAEPTLSTLSGQQAAFLSGGQFPIPVPGEGGTVTIDFKDFGIGLNFLPVVLDAKQINLKIDIGVSELSSQSSVSIGVNGSSSDIFVPALTKRSASSTVELADGQTIGIAGLINESTREQVSKIPGLGDLPVLGALFRSKEFSKGQTELVIFVTPHLAKPVNKRDIRLPTDNFVDPSYWDFYMTGTVGRTSSDVSSISANKGGTSGEYGHMLGHSSNKDKGAESKSSASSAESIVYDGIVEP